VTAEPLDPLIHAPARLRIVATLSALPDGDSLSFTRLQDMLGLTPGNLITHLRRTPATSGARRPETAGHPAPRSPSHAKAGQRSRRTPVRSATCSAGCRSTGVLRASFIF